MSYRTIIDSALTNPFHEKPVAFQCYRGNSKKYITYFCYNQQGEAWAENKEIVTGFYIQIDIWYDTSDYEELAEQIKTALEAVGFQGYTAQDLYEPDTKIYHK
ncbi:MAG: hypothetical protein A2Y15_08715, partial [Clostridiales bacterium GWF2_36_10]